MNHTEGSHALKGNERAFVIAAVLVAALIAVALYAAIAGTTGSSATAEDGTSPVALEPYTADDAAGSGAGAEAGATPEVSKVVLTGRAVGRIGLQTATVSTRLVGTQRRQVIPFSAVLYDADGVAWVYTNPEPLTYVRQRLAVDRVAGNDAVLSSGPPAGTTVVTAGAAELFGAEIEFSK